MAVTFDRVLISTEDGVSLYGETWPYDTAERVARALQDALESELPARPRTIRAGQGVLKITRDRTEVRIVTFSRSPIYGTDEWARTLLGSLKEALRKKKDENGN